MSSVTQLGSYAKYLGLVRNLTAGQKQIDDLSTQLTTGKKSIDLNAYGAETQKLLDLRAEMAKRDNYVQNIDTASPRLKATDTVLSTLEQMASDWQSNNLMPFQPGPPSVTSAFNANPNGMKVTVNADKSSFTQNARYTVSAVPSKTGENGTFDVTLTDGLGGTTTRAINLKTVPPNDGGGYNFKIIGGPGGGAVVNLNFDQLASASTSNFTVNWPQANDTRDRVEGAMRDMQQLLNERFGDRFLFGGARYDKEPVSDLLAAPQKTKVTLNGAIVNTDDYFEVTIDGKPFSYQVQANDPKSLSFVAGTLNNMIRSADPKLPMTAMASSDGVITLVGDQSGQTFDVQARVVNAMTVDNSISPPTTTQQATLPAPAGTGAKQIDSFTLTGQNVDIGDTYQFSVEVGDPGDPYNLKYYQQNPNEPKDLPPYQKYTVSYTVSEQDYNGGVTDVSKVADQLRLQYAKLNPQPPVGIDAVGSGSSISLTSNTTMDPNHPSRVQQFATSAKAINGSIDNTVQVTTLPPESDSITDLPYVDPPNLPFYDSEALTTKQNIKASQKPAVTIDDGQSISYGVTSTDRAIQKLVTAFRMARVAASNPGQYEQYIAKSRELMSQAKDEVRSVHAKVASDIATLDQKKSEHKDAIATVTQRIAGIEGIDETEVAARLKSSMNTLEAAYTVAGQTQKLSLLNYLA
ncbi:hypothetical protein [Azospirillum canadense]|uniref:hypothetical protein n=1 Tax=Azospirillum canadense TaxID=403962 RepID=UPI0022279F1A|nr:hypothetical protein [Azospirillum canadense]MCW2243911.1 flagellin-like hook-associated protein FlgL [Azospirillum canadense]